MREFQIIIQDALGIHARPAGELSAMAKQFTSDILLRKADQEADLKNPLALMRLAVKQGECVTILADGADEEEALERLKAFFENIM